MSASTQLESGFLARAFPPPRFLAMPAAGIDISDYSIKFALLERHRSRTRLASFGKLDLPPGTVENGDIKEPAVLAQHLAQLAHDHNISFAHLCLPEEHAYLFQMEAPPASEGEIEQVLEFHLKENVPLGPEEAVFDYVLVERPSAPAYVNVSVYPRQFIAQYLEVLMESGITPLSLEIEGQATARALIAPEDGASIIMDIGRSEASLTIVSDGLVTFTATLETGGDNLTQAIVKKLAVSYQEAERLKRDVGFLNTEEHAPLFQALKPVVTALAEAVSRHVEYNRQQRIGAGQGRSVRRLVLSGGNANARGIPEYLEEALDVRVEVANVWRNILASDDVPPISRAQSLEYATALGLALRSIDRGR